MTMTSLESLPPDIHFQILSHHFEVSVGNRRLASHPYLCLSAVSRSFRYTVESYCYHILQSNWNHLQSSKSTIPRPPFITPTIPTYRQVWLTDAYRRCRFCNASTKSVSSADSSVRCCRRCDRRKCQLLAQWSNKINCSQAAREYGVPEDTILDHLPHAINGDFIMVSKLQVSEFAARFHKVDNIEEYLTARREVCKNVQDHFVAESARLWMERLITLAVLDRKWREELEKEVKSEAEVGMMVQERKEEWRLEWERNRDREWKSRYPWYGDIDKENVEIYRYMREQKERQKRGAGSEERVVGLVAEEPKQSLEVKRGGVAYQSGEPSSSGPPAKKRHLADYGESAVGVQRGGEENQSVRPSTEAKKDEARENQSGEPVMEAKNVGKGEDQIDEPAVEAREEPGLVHRGWEGENQYGEPAAEAKRVGEGENERVKPAEVIENSGEGENQNCEPVVEAKNGEESGLVHKCGGVENQSIDPANRNDEGGTSTSIPRRRASV